ncbi:hypothetical protein [Tenacibaculum sp. C7A-26P2]|uniref:hypothetical protein n=1 Tax=Tenacibaculum sp. C7A-26P2 TaxID=3447504 RepID=UPI003F87C408
MKTLKYLISCSLLIGGLNLVQAQDGATDSHSLAVTIPEVALIDLESSTSTSITLEVTAPTEAGEAATFPDPDTSIWMNYSSIVNGTEDSSRNVTVVVSNGTIPPGTKISLVAASDAGGGAGTMGTPTASIDLSTSAQNLVTDIGSAYTGSGVSAGHNLTYTLALSDDADAYSNLDANDSTTLTVLYTLSDN